MYMVTNGFRQATVKDFKNSLRWVHSFTTTIISLTTRNVLKDGGQHFPVKF